MWDRVGVAKSSKSRLGAEELLSSSGDLGCCDAIDNICEVAGASIPSRHEDLCAQVLHQCCRVICASVDVTFKHRLGNFEIIRGDVGEA